uniref:5'-3' DNA helicase ZGRF1-like N-terminal domain-containing protein n=1 Tax=Peronospora matthiolae TaxID=2874970 RepID=A0AAV1UPQ0_9STRA
MTKLCDLLGSRSEVMFECMYTKHKTQKRKIWQDGFVRLHASRKLVVYADDEGAAGKAIDDTKLTAVEWDCKDEEYIETSKFLVEIVNEAPVASAASNQTGRHAFENKAPRLPTSSSDSKFRTPLNRGLQQKVRSGAIDRVEHPNGRHAAAPSSAPSAAPISAAVAPSSDPCFDFVRNPTSEWTYVANAISRTPDEVLALLEK